MRAVRRIAKWTLIVLAIAFVAIQFVPVDRTNPPVETEVPAGPEARAVLRESCYDCHSNESVWPWYSRIAPVSWLLADHVHEAREEMNFSTWNRMTPKERNKAIREVWEEVEKGKMPLKSYLPLHRNARLTEEDRLILRTWSESGGSENSN